MILYDTEVEEGEEVGEEEGEAESCTESNIVFPAWLYWFVLRNGCSW